MKISRKDFFRISMGGLVANQIMARIDNASAMPHVPTQSTVPSVVPESTVEADNRFWSSHISPDDRYDIAPGLIYARFESHELKTRTAIATWDPPYFENKLRRKVVAGDDGEKTYEVIKTDPSEWIEHLGSKSGGFANGYVPFSIDPFNKDPFKERLTYAETNMTVSGRFLAPEHFAITGLSVILDRNTSDADAALFERHVCVRFMIGSKYYMQVQATRVTNRADMDRLVKRGTPTDLMPNKMFRCDPPLIVSSDSMPFHFLLDTWSTEIDKLGDFGGYIMMDGYHARGVC